MTLLVAGVLLLFLVQAPRIGLVAGRIPFVVLGLTLILVCWQLVRELVLTQRRSTDTASVSHDTVQALRAIAWIFVLLLAVLVAGVVPGVGVFCLLFLRLQAGESRTFSLSYSVVLSACLYLLFDRILGASLYAGFWA